MPGNRRLPVRARAVASANIRPRSINGFFQAPAFRAFMCAIVRIGFAVTQTGNGYCVSAKQRAKFIEADANESWLLDEDLQSIARFG